MKNCCCCKEITEGVKLYLPVKDIKKTIWETTNERCEGIKTIQKWKKAKELEEKLKVEKCKAEK